MMVAASVSNVYVFIGLIHGGIVREHKTTVRERKSAR